MRSVLFIFVLTISILLSIQGNARAGEQPGQTNVYGWAWVGAGDEGGPPTYGWLSVNCNNFVGGNLKDTCQKSKYGLHIDPVTGDISGYAWSAVEDPASGNPAGLGWIDFQPNPFPAETPNHVLRGEPRNGNNPSAVSGWFTNETLATYGLDKVNKPDWGWMLAQEGGSPNGAWLDYNVEPPELHGWIWSGGGTDANGDFDQNIGLGWVSLNCKDVLGSCGTSNYAIKFDGGADDDGFIDLIGYAWIGAPCVYGEKPNGDCFQQKKTDPLGWVSFSCKNDEKILDDPNFCQTVSDYQVKYNPTTGVFKGYAYIGGEGGGGMWLNNISGAFPDYPQHAARFFFQDTQAEADDNYANLDGKDGYQAGQVAGWARVLSLKDYGITKLGVPSLGWIQLRGNWATEKDDNHRGVAINFDTGAISGWAWGGGTKKEYENFGPGWIQFSGNVPGGSPFSPTYQAPYVTATEGNIYAQKSVGIDTETTRESFAPPANRYNATYLIQSSGDIVHYQSENKDVSQNIENLLLPKDTPLTFPQAGNRYRDILGKIDIAALTTTVDGEKNRFGHTLVTSTEKSLKKLFPGNGDALLNGMIYDVTPQGGTFFIDKDFSVKNASKTDSGAGLFIIHGHLEIQNNVRYTDSPKLKTITNLGSLAWIVEGDITIQGGEAGDVPAPVENLAGAYIALGKSDGTLGALSTGLSETQSLAVSGLLMARAFHFQRQFIGTFDAPEPAEAVIYDGRLHANVPPGLEDFTAGFPILKDVTP